MEADLITSRKLSESNLDQKSDLHLSLDMQPPTIPVLRRGEACVECRRRKLRCDGAKPNCQICLKAERKCRYEKILARPVYLVLQERLTALEKRYQHLTRTSSSPARHNRTIPSIPNTTPTPLHDMTGRWWEPEELSPAIRDYLLNIFVLHYPSIHFYFHEPTFRARLASSEETERPHRALLESIYLFACYFSSRFPENQSLVHHEEHFLRRARQALMESLSYSDRLMDFLRGSVLLTTYLYMRGRFLEGYHVHCGAARFALSCGLHRLTSHVFNSPVYTDLISSNVVLLQPPANEIEVGNRIATFWMIYMCDKISSVIAGFVCALPCESDAVDAVETVFPRTMKEYELGTVSDVGSGTLLSLFDISLDPSIATPQCDTAWTVILKGFAILERAIKLGTAYRARPTEDTTVSLRQLEIAANRFLSTLRPMAYFTSDDISIESMAEEDMAAWMAHSTVLGALMEIHQTLVDIDENASEARVACAKSMAELTAGVTEGGLMQACFIGVGFCWCLAAQVLIQHIESNYEKEAFVDDYEVHLAKLVSALEKLSPTFPTLVLQFKRVQEALGRLGGLSGAGVFVETNSESE